MQPNDQQSPDLTNTTPTEPTKPAESPENAAVPTPIETTPAVDEQPTVAPQGSVIAPSVDTPQEVAPSAPSPVTPEAPVPVVAGSPKKGRFSFSKKTKFIALIVLILVLLGGASAGAYFGVIAPSKPQRVIGDSLSNTLNSEKVKSAKFEGEANCIEGEACKSFSTVTFKGAASENGSFDANVQFKTAVATVSLDARYLEKSIYLRLSGLNGLDKLLAGTSASSTSGTYAQLIKQLNNNWYVVDESLLKQMGGNNVSFSSSQDRLSKEDAQKIGDAYKKHQFIKVDKKLADEKIHGQSSYHILATVDKTQLKAFVTEVKNANLKDVKIEQSDIDAIDKVDFSKYPFDIWVSKSNRMVSQLATTIKQDGTTVRVRVALYDYNQPVTVEKPAGAKSVLELLSEVSPLYSGGVQGADSENPLSLLGI